MPADTVSFVPTAAFRPSLPVRLVLLAAAYAPLLLLLAVLDSFGITWLRWALVGLSIVGVLGTVLFLRVAVARRNAVPELVWEARPREGEALKFFASYVVPFFVTQSAAPTVRWGLALYIVIIAVLYVQADMYFSNPLLGLLGYRVFELTRQDGGFLLVISREWHLAPRQLIRLAPLGGYIHFQVRTTGGD